MQFKEQSEKTCGQKEPRFSRWFETKLYTVNEIRIQEGTKK